MARFMSTCAQGHRSRQTGALAAWRSDRWWRKHAHPETPASLVMVDQWRTDDGTLICTQVKVANTFTPPARG